MDQNTAVDEICVYEKTRPTKDQIKRALIDLAEGTRNGVSSINVVKLVNFVSSPNKLTSSSNIFIIRECLYPQSPVPSKAVVKIVSRLGETNVPATVKTRLLRWLVIVYDYLDDKLVMQQLYGALFTNLRYEMPRQWTCHLLFMSTTREVVKPWRVKYLLELYHANKESQHVAGLLALYRDLVPSLVVETLPSVRPKVFSHPDENALQRLKKTQGNANKTTISGLKKHKGNIPEINTSGSGGAEGVRTLSEFASRVHKLNFPQQMGSVLNDTGMLVRLLRYRPDEDSWERLNTWLGRSLNDTLLERVYEFTDQSKVFPAAAQDYLLKRLDEFDGRSDIVMKGLGYVNKCDAELIATPLSKLVGQNQDQWKVECIHYLAQMKWKDAKIDDLVTTTSEKLLSDCNIAAEEAVLKYFRTDMPPSIKNLLSNSSLPSTVVELQAPIDPLSPQFLFKGYKHVQRLESSQFHLKAQHGCEPVTRQSLEILRAKGGLDMPFDEYVQSFTSYLQNPTSVLI